MSINLLFQKANKLFLNNKHIEGLNILKDIWFNYPKNTRLNEEINKNIKKFKKSITPTFSQKEIDVFFQLHRENKTKTVIQNLEKILLIDIEKTESQNHGFNEKGSGYANLIDTKNFLITNDISSNKIITCNPEKHKIPKFKFDLLISLFSMGFHYPCNEYTDFILKNASHRSKIIYDKRRNVFDKGHETLQQKLKFLKKIPRIKHDRILMEMV